METICKHMTPPSFFSPLQLSAWHRGPKDRSASNQVTQINPLSFLSFSVSLSSILTVSPFCSIWTCLSLFVCEVSKCLTLLIEIHPINNTKVLKAVDCRVRVQVVCVCVCFSSSERLFILQAWQKCTDISSPSPLSLYISSFHLRMICTGMKYHSIRWQSKCTQCRKQNTEW